MGSLVDLRILLALAVSCTSAPTPPPRTPDGPGTARAAPRPPAPQVVRMEVVRASAGHTPIDLRFRDAGDVVMTTLAGERLVWTERSLTRLPDAAPLTTQQTRTPDAVCVTGPSGQRVCVACEGPAQAVMTRDRRQLALVCDDVLSLWDIVQGMRAGAVELAGPVRHLLVDDEQRAIAVGPTWIVVADPAGAAAQWYHTGTSDHVAVAAHGGLLAAADADALEIWLLDDRTRTARVPLPAPARRIAVDHDGARIAVAGDGWLRVYDRKGVALEHTGTAERGVADLVVGPGGVVLGADELGGVFRLDPASGTLRQDRSPHERGFAERTPPRLAAVAGDGSRLLVQDGPRLRLHETTGMREVLRIPGALVRTIDLQPDQLAVRYAGAVHGPNVAGPDAFAVWDLRSGALRHAPLAAEPAGPRPLQRVAVPLRWRLVTDASGTWIEARTGDRPVYRSAGGLEPRMGDLAAALVDAGAPATPRAPSLRLHTVPAPAGRADVVATIDGGPDDAVVCVYEPGDVDASRCAPVGEELAFPARADAPIRVALVSAGRTLQETSWSPPRLAARDASISGMLAGVQSIPTVHTRDGCRTLLGSEPVAVGGYATLMLPDGLGLVARGSGLWTGVERTLSTCDVEVSRAVVAALPAPRGSLRAILERILPGAEHRGRSVTDVVDTDALFEAEVALPWQLPRRSARVWLSVRRVGAVAWVVLLQTTPRDWFAARDAFAAASRSLTVHATPPALARTVPFQRVHWTGIGRIAALEELGYPPYGLQSLALRDGTAELRALHQPDLAQRLPRAAIDRVLDHLDMVRVAALSPPLPDEDRAASIVSYSDLTVSAASVHMADLDAGGLTEVMDSVRSCLRAATAGAESSCVP